METLIQKRLLDNRQLKILPSKLTYHDERLGSRSIDLNIPFEEITGTKLSHSYSEYIFLGVSAFSFLFSIFAFVTRNDEGSAPALWIVFAFAGLFGLVYFFLKRENSWKIRLGASAYIYIHKSIPDPETVDKFIDRLFETREKYLRETYLKFDPNLRYDNQYHNLKWMLSSDVITKDEFETKYEELKSLYSSERTIKGFGR